MPEQRRLRMTASLTVKIEQLNGQRMFYVDRTDLQMRIEGDTYTEMRRKATAILKEKDFIVVSCGHIGPQRMQAIVRMPASEKPQSPLLYKTSPVPLKVTAAGRIRR